MKKTILMMLFLISMIMGLTACQKKTDITLENGDTPAVEEAVTEPEETVAEPEEAVVEDEEASSTEEAATVNDDSVEYVFPSATMSDWQNAYQTKLCEIREANDKLNMPDDGAKSAESYFLYDTDYSGVPELYVKYGDCEAAYHIIVYEYIDGQVKELGELDAGHTSFYSTPKDGLMSYWGHQGYAGADLLTLKDGKFENKTISEQDITSDLEQGYEEADALVEGAKYLVTQKINLDLPIELYGKTLSNTAGTLSNEEVHEMLQNAYMKNEEVYGVSGDGYGGDTGMIGFDEYCQPKMIDEFIEEAATVADQQWVDLNQDGQDECVLKMDTKGEYPVYVMLSLQNQTVYAYAFHYWDDDVTFSENGTFTYETAYYNRIVFDKTQCYVVEE